MTRPPLSSTILFTLVGVLCIPIAVDVADAADELRSLDPEVILTKLDLDSPGLEAVKSKHATDRLGALAELLAHYREKYPPAEASREDKRPRFPAADRVVNHVFQWGPYEPADYGPVIDWQADPRGDIEWVAAVYRFYWTRDLVPAYEATGDEKYARAFVELATDWISKHPLEKRDIRHPVYKSWRGFPWLDIQTGIRADIICNAFPVLVHAESFTPEFLGVLLASLHDHQVKTETLPMGKVHNKAIFEQRGFVAIAWTFQEFRDSRRWMELAMRRARENFLAQVTADGVQREWSFGYNGAVLNDAVTMMGRMDSMGITVPDDYRDRIRAMYDYIFAIASPQLSPPMFGDASRHEETSPDRADWALYETLVGATELLGAPKYAARAKLDRDRLPAPSSQAFLDAGTYVFRDDWGPEQICFYLHCPPRGISGHDQADNGTFELAAFGRWLMPDSGYYTYGHDPRGRAWHRQTAVHQTLTLDGKNAQIGGRQLLWHSSDKLDALVVENPSYPGLIHRRTVWFVDKRFFVLLDEAIGDAVGTVDLHFQLAPGDAKLDCVQHTASTTFDDANVLIWMAPDALVTMEEEEGWYAWKYGHRKPRPAFCYRHANATGTAAFLTVVYPYRGSVAPVITAALPEGFKPGLDRVEIRLEANASPHRLGRDLKAQQAWSGADE